MLKKNISKVMAATTILTAATPMATAFADVIESNQEQEIKEFKQKVYDIFNTKYASNAALLKNAEPGAFVYSSVVLNNGEEDITCENYAKFEKEFDKAFSSLENNKKITVSYESDENVRILEDGTVVDFRETKYEGISSEDETLGTDGDAAATDILDEIVYGELADNTQYAKLPITDGYITVKDGDVILDATRPQFKVVNGYYVDAKGNSIKKYVASQTVADVEEVTELGGVIEGYYAWTDAEALSTKKGTVAIVKTATAVTKEDVKVSDLYEASTGRLTKKGNELRKVIAQTPVKESDDVTEEAKLQVEIFATNKAGEKVDYDAENLANIKIIFEERANAHTDWSPVYEMTITEDRGHELSNIADFVIENTENDATGMPITAGLDRYKTAIETSKQGWGDGEAEAVVLVSGANDKLVDGLAATPLAAKENAPILLTQKDTISQEVIDEILRVSAEDAKVYIVGGTSAVSESVETLLTKTYKKEVIRLEGEDRYETSLAVAEAMLEAPGTKELEKVFVVGGKGEADALSVSSIAALEEAPILLTSASNVSKDLIHFLDKNVADEDVVTDIFVAGGVNSVSDSVQNKLVDLGYEVERLAGEGRQETNAKVIKRFADVAENVVVAKSNNSGLVDALAAGAFAAHMEGGAHILLATDEVTETQEDNLRDAVSDAETVQVGYGIATKVAAFLKSLR